MLYQISLVQMTVRDALNSAMDEEMARDDKVNYVSRIIKVPRGPGHW